MVLTYLASYVYGSGAASQPSTSQLQPAASTARVRTSRRRTSSSNGSVNGSSSVARGTGLSSSRGRERQSTRECDCECQSNNLPPCTCDTALDYDDDAAKDPSYAIIDYINHTRSLYDVLGVSTRFKNIEELRRAYMARCRVCHPDKFPSYAEHATSAFQRVSLAYETLSKPSSRRAYDISGARDGFSGPSSDPMGAEYGDETLRNVLYTMYCEFLENGQLEMVRVLVEALNATNPGLNLGEDAIVGIETALRRLRGFLLSSAKHFRVVKFELIKLYEIQHDLRQLSYFDVFGRLRLSLQLARVTLSIPMAIDKAMLEDEAYNSGSDPESSSSGASSPGSAGFVENSDPLTSTDRQITRKSLLGPRITSVLNLAVAVLEKGERII